MARYRRPRKRASLVHILIVIGLLALASRAMPVDILLPSNTAAPAQGEPQLTAQGLQHITTGDHRGGGHLHGMGVPCKSEFPASWTREKIARDIPLMAANDNLKWQDGTHGNGYIIADSQTADGLQVRIVVNPRNNEIVTAYPTNVRRNPCPANDNRRR